MKADTLRRRSRYAGPQPLLAYITINEADLAIFRALDRHGQLPSPYLFELTKSHRKNRTHFNDRVTDLYNGYCDHAEHHAVGFAFDASGIPRWNHQCVPTCFLARDRAQLRTMRALSQSTVYKLTDRARKALDACGGGRRYRPRKDDNFLHQLYGGCLSASFEASGLTFIHAEDILANANNKSLTVNNSITPDNLFGVQYPDSGRRYFAVEIDRNTESIKGKAHNTIERKIRAYVEILEGREFEQWGIKNLTVLIATANARHMENMIELVRAVVPEHRQRKFLFKACTEFDTDRWRVPREFLPVLDPWASALGPIDISIPNART